MSDKECELLIVGGGVAGMTAGIYASRAGLESVLVERLMPGGQIVNADKIENMPGFPNGIPGYELGSLLVEQATKYGLKIEISEVTGLEPRDENWLIRTYEGLIDARVVIIAGGSKLRKLGVPGEEQLVGSGVSYCATCDGAFFRDETVAVIGGGDSALDEALVLTEFASRVILIHRRDEFRGQKVLQDQVTAHPKVEVYWNTIVDSIIGEHQVEGINTSDVVNGGISRVDLSGVFVYVGLEPNSSYLDSVVTLDNAGHIPTDICMRTARPGLLAAGDIRQNSAAQLSSSAGDGATAAIAAQRYIISGKWTA